MRAVIQSDKGRKFSMEHEAIREGYQVGKGGLPPFCLEGWFHQEGRGQATLPNLVSLAPAGEVKLSMLNARFGRLR